MVFLYETWKVTKGVLLLAWAMKTGILYMSTCLIDNTVTTVANK